VLQGEKNTVKVMHEKEEQCENRTMTVAAGLQAGRDTLISAFGFWDSLNAQKLTVVDSSRSSLLAQWPVWD